MDMKNYFGSRSHNDVSFQFLKKQSSALQLLIEVECILCIRHCVMQEREREGVIKIRPPIYLCISHGSPEKQPTGYIHPSAKSLYKSSVCFCMPVSA